MTEPVTVMMLGAPVPYARTRRNFTTGVPFTPKTQRNAAAALKVLGQQEMVGREPFRVPLLVYFTAEFAVPASWSRKKQAAALAGELHPAGRPDLSNLLKLAEDALNGVVWHDDALIVRCEMQKKYGGQPKIVITARPL